MKIKKSSYNYKLSLRPEERNLLKILVEKGYAKGVYDNPSKAAYGRYKLRKAIFQSMAENMVSTSLQQNEVYVWIRDILGSVRINEDIKQEINLDEDSHVRVIEGKPLQDSNFAKVYLAELLKKGINLETGVFDSFDEYQKAIEELEGGKDYEEKEKAK